MRRSLMLVTWLLLLSSMAYSENLHRRFKDSPLVKVFLKDVRDDSGNPAVSVEDYRRIFRETLDDRVNMKFRAVDSDAEADVVVEADIKSYAFSEKPLPRFYSAYAVVADVTAPKSSGKIVVDYRVKEPSSGKMLLHFRSFTTEQSMPMKDMEGPSGFVNTAGESIDRFIYRAFYPAKRRPHLGMPG